MPVVLVHGNPETAVIWDPMVAALQARGVEDIRRLSPPGFGAPVPENWPATMASYRAWLIEELEQIGEPVDLVGHDWGAGHTFGVVAERPDLIRTWAADCAGLIHPDYRWHPFARVWQAPWLGELAAWSMTLPPLWFRDRTLTRLGLPADAARSVADQFSPEMSRCIVALYRSARQPAMRRLGERLVGAPRSPGLLIIPTADPFSGPADPALEVARELEAATVVLEDHTHWWMFEGAEAAADALVRHWHSASEAPDNPSD